MTANTNLDLTLEALEGERWEEPASQSHLVLECHRLRRVPIGQLTIEELRVMIGQQLGLPFLVPLALEKLEADPFAEGDFYAGDLLLAVLRVKPEFWQGHAQCLARLTDVMSALQERVEFVREEALPAWNALFK